MRPYVSCAAALVLAVAARAQTFTVPAGERVVIRSPDTLAAFTDLAIAGVLVVDVPTAAVPPSFAGAIRVQPGGVLRASGLTLKPAAASQRAPLLTVERGAGPVELTRVRIADARDPAEAAAVVWEADGGRVLDCDVSSRSTALEVRGSGVRVSRTRFAGTAERLVVVAPAGIARGTALRNCDLSLVSDAAGAVALHVGNPYQALVGNDVAIAGPGTALRLRAPDGYGGFTWTHAGGSLPECRGNRLRQAAAPRLGTGLEIGRFATRERWTIGGLDVRDFATGIRAADTRVRFDSLALLGNAVGVAAGYLRVSDAHIDGGAGGEGLGVRLVAPAAGLYLDGVELRRLATGLRLDAALAHTAKLQAVGFAHTTHPLQLSSTAQEGAGLEWADGSVPRESPAPSGVHSDPHAPAPADGGEHHGHHHHAAPEPSSLTLLPVGHPQGGDLCATYDEWPGWRVCPSALMGRLEVATGHGLSDPVDEHRGQFTAARLTLTGSPVAPVHSDFQSIAYDIHGGDTYTLSASVADGRLDRYVGWAAGAPVTIALAGVGDAVAVAAPLGGLVPEVSSRSLLAAATSTAVYRPSDSDTAWLRLVPVHGSAEVVTYERRQRYDYGSASASLHVDADRAALVLQAPPEAAGAVSVTVTDEMGAHLVDCELGPGQTRRIGAGELGGLAGGWLFVGRGEERAKGVWAVGTAAPPARADHAHHSHH